MKKLVSLFTLTLVASAAFVSIASTSEAAAGKVKLRKISRITAPHEATTQHLIKALKTKIETQCRALSSSDTLEVLNEKIVQAFEYGGREVVVGKPACNEQDLPCSAVPTRRVDTYTLRALDLTLVRKSGGQRYYIKASTQWDLDLPMPQIDIQLDSKYCR